jgi:hypothetical protein
MISIKDLCIEYDITNDKTEYRIVNGIGGMYAIKPIEQGDIICYGETDRLKILNYEYPINVSNSVKYIHSYLYNKSKIPSFFNRFEQLEKMRNYQLYFCNQEELEFIKNINIIVYENLLELIKTTNTIVDYLHNLDPRFTKDEILEMTLNYNCRSWNEGTVPVLELYNHSAKLGLSCRNEMLNNKNIKKLIAKVKYNIGDQVFISYGIKDAIQLAVTYNFYDINDYHTISINNRVQFNMNTDDGKIAYLKLKDNSLYNIKLLENNDKKLFKVNGGNLNITELGPTYELLKFCENFAYNNNDDAISGKIDPIKKYKILQSWLLALNNINNIDKYSIEEFPTRLRFLYPLLQREKDIIITNINYLNRNIELASENIIQLQHKEK